MRSAENRSPTSTCLRSRPATRSESGEIDYPAQAIFSFAGSHFREMTKNFIPASGRAHKLPAPFPSRARSRGVVRCGKWRRLRLRLAPAIRDGTGFRPAATRPPARSMADGAALLRKCRTKSAARVRKNAGVERCEAMRLPATGDETKPLRLAALRTLDIFAGSIRLRFFRRERCKSARCLTIESARPSLHAHPRPGESHDRL